jgi:hypothetical protein
MLFRLVDRLPLRAQRWFYLAMLMVTHVALVAGVAYSAWTCVRSLTFAHRLQRMTGSTLCVAVDVDVEEPSMGTTLAHIDCRYTVDGHRYRGRFPLPRFSTIDRDLARSLATTAAGSGALVVHYDPSDPWLSSFDPKPDYARDILELAMCLGILAWVGRSVWKQYPLFRSWWFLEQVLERAEASKGAAKTTPDESGATEKEEPAAKRREAERLEALPDERGSRGTELRTLSARNHLPAQPPPGWSVPMASTEGRGAWMIETPGVLLVTQLVRMARGRVALQVALIPENRRRLEDPQALSLLRHFRAVDEFVEPSDREDDLARESPWVRVFVAIPKMASPDTWGEVKQPREQLN